MNYLAFYTHRSDWHTSGGWLGVIIFILLLILAFEIWMLVDVITNKKVPTVHKVWWVIGMFLIHPIVAIVYFFVRSQYNRT